jgi:hypothetical protein
MSCLSSQFGYTEGMNATAEKLDHFLREADPRTARTVEEIVNGLLSLRSKPDSTGQVEHASNVRYQLPERRLGVRQNLDLTKLAHADEDA